MSHRRNSKAGMAQPGDRATAAVGEGMESLAGMLREKLPDSGMIGAAKRPVAAALEQGSRYLRDEGLQGMTDDLSQVIRSHPLPAIFVAIGIGYFLARLTHR